MKIQKVPSTVLDIIKKDLNKAPFEKPVLTSEDSASKILRFVRYLERIPPAIEGQGGDLATYKAACVGLDEGLSEQLVLEKMLNHFNPKCLPEWTPEELQEKVTNAFKYAKGRPDHRNLGLDFVDSDYKSKNANHPNSLETFTASELIQRSFPESRWAIPEILPEGLIILAGSPKIGKSWLAFGLALSVAAGGKALGGYSANQGQVLYLALEDSQRRLQHRLMKLTDEKPNTNLENLSFSDFINRYDQGGRRELERWLAEHPNCLLVIIDTLARFTPAPNGRMNAYDNDSRVLSDIQKLALEKKIALVLITHLRKQTTNDPLEQVMGSMGVTGTADAIWLLKRHRGSREGKLHILGRDIEEQELAVEFETETCQWKTLGNAARHQLGKQRKQILEYLEQAKEPVGPKEVAQALGLKEGNVKNLMRKMHLSGQIYKKDRGKYLAMTPNDDFRNLE